MISRYNLLLILSVVPFIVFFWVNLNGFKFINEVEGLNSSTLVIPFILLVYYLTIIALIKSVSRVAILVLCLAILGVMFLPIRQNISIAHNIETQTEVFWIERPYWSGSVSVFKSKKNVVLVPEKLFFEESGMHEARLDQTGDKVMLVFKRYNTGTYENLTL
jgi:hypothetical protein